MQFSFGEMWQHMGTPAVVVAIVLLAMGLASMTVFVERVITLRRSRAASRQLASEIGAGMEAGKFDEIIATAEQRKGSYLARVLRAGLTTYRHAQSTADISGLTHGIGWCAPQQGACKLSLNVKEGIIQEALVETIGCSGMTHSAAMAAEILIGKTIIEAMNTDLVCDAINTAMRELFLQIIYGRSQSAFSEGGLPIGAGLEDLGKGLRSQVGTMYATLKKGPRYLEMAEGYITRIGVDKEGAIIGYEFVSLGKFMDAIKKGTDANEALAKAKGTYGRFNEAAKQLDPRHE